ncbi:hypothetical protein [Streptomyces sioyaensis]|uniref:hypothetical protein n=1 Tax=Streptomyces sioyaensis TaxID=67364 RepID=UPI003796974A
MTAPKTLAAEVNSALSEVATFVCSPEMRGVIQELYDLAEEERASYVLSVLLNEGELRKRKIIIPSGMVIQRSAFRDNRPTLFCVTKHLPPGLGWEKVTITFDNTSGMPALAYSQFEDQSSTHVLS